MDNVQYTLVVTSCGRHDLLYRTLDSFAQFADILPTKTIIIEDGSKEISLERLPKIIGKVQVISNGRNKGQIYSIDRAYSEVETPYIFHCEDDWEFTGGDFIQKSLELLSDPDVISVSLRSEWGHPEEDYKSFKIAERGWANGWGSFAFNPGLRRLSDWQKIGSYGRLIGYDPRICGELELSKFYAKQGKVIAIGPKVCKHIGGEAHVDFLKNKKPPKVLIAVPACWKYEYKEHADGRAHKNHINNERVEGIRDTWAKYMPAFASYVDLKFFYGHDKTDTLHQTHWPRHSEQDEVFLNVADDYKNLPYKIQAIYKWALDNGYDYVFKCDDDTFIYVDRLMASGFENYDYTGFVSPEDCYKGCPPYASGGSGYWVSRKAMEAVVKASVGNEWAEDKWVGDVLSRNGIKPVRDARYLPGFWEHFVNIDALPAGHSYITMHSCTPDMMCALFEKSVCANFTPVKIAFHENMDTEDIALQDEINTILQEVLIGDMPDLNKDLKNKVNKSIEKLVNVVMKQSQRINILEDRLEKYNMKAAHKI